MSRWHRRSLAGLVGMILLFGCAGVGVPLHAQSTVTQQQQPSPGIGEQSSPINSVPEKREQEKDENREYTHSATVVKLGSLIGLSADQAAIAFEVLNFLVLALALGYFGSKTLPKRFRERSSLIQRQLVEARTATEEANARLTAVETRLSKLDGEIAAMRSQIESETERDEKRAAAALEEETAKILAAADAEIQSATAAARRELQRHAAELAVEHAAKRLVVTAQTDRLLIEGFARRLSGDNGGQN